MKLKNIISPKYRQYIIPSVLLLFCVASFILFILPLIKKTYQEFQNIADLRGTVSKLQSDLSTLQNTDESSLEQNFDLLISAIPSEKDLVRVFNTVQGLSDASGISLGTLTISGSSTVSSDSAQVAEDTTKGPSSFDFALDGTGTSQQIFSFLTTSTKIKRIIKPTNINLSFAAPSSPNASVGATLQMAFQTFYNPLIKTEDIGELQTIDNNDLDILAKLNSFQDFSVPPATTQTTPPVLGVKPNPFGF